MVCDWLFPPAWRRKGAVALIASGKEHVQIQIVLRNVLIKI